MKVAFVLDMPGVGSWNGKFTGSDRIYARERDVPPETRRTLLINSPFFYRWNDGWEARIVCKSVKDARGELNKSAGFMGYDWMIDSLIATGGKYILTNTELREWLNSPTEGGRENG